MMRIHIGWMLTKIAANSVHNVGAWTCKQVPLRLALHLHHTNCVRLSITVIINATWNPWKKSTIPLPAPLFMKVAPTFRRAATTIGQHQAPMMAGKDRHRTPIAPRNWQNVIGSVFLSTESGSPVGSSSGGGPQSEHSSGSATGATRGSSRDGIAIHTEIGRAHV